MESFDRHQHSQHARHHDPRGHGQDPDEFGYGPGGEFGGEGFGPRGHGHPGGHGGGCHGGGRWDVPGEGHGHHGDPEGFDGPWGMRFARGFGGRRRRGDVSLALLLVLADEGPRNGYQLIQSLEERSQGAWHPSPGSVYPALSQLEDRGLVTSQTLPDQSGHTYELTDEGRKSVEERADEPAPWEPQNGRDSARRELHRTAALTVMALRQLAHDGDEQQIAKATELFAELRRQLYRILAGDLD
jgi:DNA-binding PadR family transcriptional regulator